MIRQVLKRRIHELKGEDQAWIELIKRNGIKNVPDEDLQELSRDRGMRAIGLTRERLEKQYQDWIELSTDPNISVSWFISDKLSQINYLNQFMSESLF